MKYSVVTSISTDHRQWCERGESRTSHMPWLGFGGARSLVSGGR